MSTKILFVKKNQRKKNHLNKYKKNKSYSIMLYKTLLCVDFLRLV